MEPALQTCALATQTHGVILVQGLFPLGLRVSIRALGVEGYAPGLGPRLGLRLGYSISWGRGLRQYNPTLSNTTYKKTSKRCRLAQPTLFSSRQLCRRHGQTLNPAIRLQGSTSRQNDHQTNKNTMTAGQPNMACIATLRIAVIGCNHHGKDPKALNLNPQDTAAISPAKMQEHAHHAGGHRDQHLPHFPPIRQNKASTAANISRPADPLSV